jgi:nicotinate-nucleotide adenylyltransferase
MRIGILGGSFDPVHHGHLILGRAAREELGLDTVLFVPAKLSPHKTHTRPATEEDRLTMVRLALADEPGFAVDDLELRRPPPSYTVDTLRELAARHRDAELFLLIGTDNAGKFDTWYQPDEIARLAQVVVLQRTADAPTHAWPVVRRLVDVSSTEIRRRVAEGRSIRYLTPAAVCDYIKERGLYRNE